ncbi:MAG: UDP-N-acetylmuramate dehydrogenase [Verrucomicrobiota bacterium]|nr:UDP-N-acetylmuramate dehydrogenase [Verrucomicrobiota bacterium]MDP7049531.1 UDP-N-acetylmuramate dehydrogenase [Verrucomicrobiota bacterium]
MSTGIAMPVAGELKEALECAAGDGTAVEPDYPLAEWTTLRAGGRADFFAEPESEAGLAALLATCRERGTPVTLLGRGSNFLPLDSGVRGLTMRLSREPFTGIEPDGPRLRCGAGAKLKHVAAEAKRSCLAGMEFLEGIPGSLGGGLRMNAGAMGSELFDIVESVRLMDPDGMVFEMPAESIEVAYRSCPLLKNQIALGAVLKGEPDTAEAIAARMAEFAERRWGSQPKARSAGCVFKNPETIPAGKLVDELGLKGASEGGAMVSEEHGNFIVNNGGATADDVLRLIGHIREQALAERGIELQTEVQIIGGEEARGD